MKRYLLNLGLIATLIFGGNVLGQTNFEWRSEAENGNWHAPTHWWIGSASTAAFGVMRFNNNAHLNMNNNNDGVTFSTHAIHFQGGNMSTRTLNGDPIRFFDFSGANPYIRNTSTGTHIINLNLSGDGDEFDPLMFQIDNTGGLTLNGNINNFGSAINIEGSRSSSGTDVSFNGVISGSGGLFKTNTNIVAVFNANNTYTGQLTIEGGSIRLGSSVASFGNNVNVRIGANGVLDLNNFDASVRSVGERGLADGGIIVLGSGTLTVNGGYSETRFQNSISGSGNLTKNGSGTLSLYGSQSFTGTTTVNGGILASGSQLASTTYFINNGGRLDANTENTLSQTATVTVNSGGELRFTENQTLNELTLNGTLHIAEGVTLTINTNLTTNTATIEGGGELIINGVWVNSAGETTIASNTEVILRSTATGTAQYGNSSGTINGNVTVERFIPKRSDNARAFRFLASPVGGVTIADSWQQNMHVTGAGGATNGFDATDSNSSSMFTFDGGWQAVEDTDVEFVHARAYRTFVRGDRTVPLNNNAANANDVTLSAKGTLATGSISAPDMASGDHEFSFVGNPYQAVVDLAALDFGSGIENGFAYYWDPTLADNGAFVIIDIDDDSIDFAPAPGSSSVNKFLQPGQAVFFRNTGAAGDRTITFTESTKRTGEPQTAIFSEPSIPFVNMRLYEANRFANGGKEQDAAGLRFFENGNNAVDSNDAAKMGNTSENFGLINSNQLLSIEQRAMPIEGEIFGLFTNNYQHSDYVFHINLQNFPEGLILKLNDTHLNETHILEAGINEITFSVDASLADSANSQRFNLEVGAVTLSVEDFQENSIEVYPNPVANELNIRLDASMQASELAIYNVVGKQVMNVSLDASLGNHQVNTTQLLSGVYLVKVQTARGSFTSKLIKK